MKPIVIFLCASFFALFLGLFMLPQQVEMIRFIDIKARPEKVWMNIATVKGWDSWDPYKKNSQQNTRPWKEGDLTITAVDADKQEIKYTISINDGEGDISLGLKPANEGTVVRWRHSYVGGYWPWERVPNWLNRGKFALELQDGLEKLKQISEEK